MKILSCNNLSVGYDGKTVAENVNFAVNKGDYLCIVGENGSGKSTLMKTLLGLIPPVSGEVIFGDGVQQNQIGYLPQQSAIQKDFPASVYEVVISGVQNKMGLRPFYNAQEKAKAQKNIDKMGLNGMEKRCYRELSGGQQQRVLLARALCATQSVLLLDEPVTGLDPNVTAELYDLVATLNQTENLTVIMISHDVKSVISYATHVLHVSQNVFFGTTEEYLASENGKRFAEVSK